MKMKAMEQTAPVSAAAAALSELNSVKLDASDRLFSFSFCLLLRCRCRRRRAPLSVWLGADCSAVTLLGGASRF